MAPWTHADDTMQIDHVFVMCDAGAPEAEALVRLGVAEGPPNVHPGQGTRCRRFFFRDAYLELLWVHDEAEVRSPSVAPTQLWERWSMRRSGACPFGIILSGGGDAAARPPWPSWDYRPPYLQPGECIAFPRETSLDEPVIAFAGFLGTGVRRHDAPFHHPVQRAALTRLQMAVPDIARQSAATRRLQDEVPIELVASERHLLRLEFGDEATDRIADLRPHLPVILAW